MTNWNLSFDYAAIYFLLMLFAWYFSEKRVPLKSHRAYLVVLIVAFLATVLEIASTWMARNMEAVGYDRFYFVLSLQTLAINVLPVTLTYYLLHIAHVDVARIKPVNYGFRLAIATNVVICLLNPWLHWAFVFEDEKYRAIGAGYVLYAIDIIMIVVCLVAFIVKKQDFKFLNITSIIALFICGVVACVAQVVWYVPMLDFAIVAFCLTVFYYQQNAGTVTDPVTRQFNRRFLGEFLQGKFLDRKTFTVLMVALDDFKFVNKTYGVEAGDQLLFQVGNYLETMKKSNAVFRFGSDQFCVVVDKGTNKAMGIAEDIQERFYHPWFNESAAAIMMSATICLVECPREADNYGSLIEVIDYAMSMAKKTKKGLITKASEIDLDKIRKDKSIEKAVKLALDREELMVYYQPIFSVEKGVYNSAEALVRLHDEELGWISPEAFIPIAEKNGLIVEMGEMILEKVCRFIRDFKLSETTVEYIEVNISPVQLIQKEFADRVIEIMDEYGVKPEQINIEITETATMTSASTVNNNINKLVEHGISLSLDDYGSGHANIDYINRMPFKIIKLDKYIIWDSFKSKKAGITLEYTIGMLNALQLYIVAEGVETAEMRDQLTQYGCHYMQGWYYSKAVADEEFMQLIEAQG